jgi:hypothetical protein
MDAILPSVERNINPEQRNETMSQIETRERMLRELMSDLANMVEAGEITDMEANEWYNMKADQWANGI